MVQWILSFLIFVSAFIVGVGAVPLYWIAGTVVAAYVKAILSVGEVVPGQDFRGLSSEEFLGSEKDVKAIFIGLLVIVFVAFGLGKLVAWIF
ncbi:hypothetical protein [Alcanivorax sp.]|jgi:hypothetical protein|uniref:hypothetical protein n=1 Tax=Alcanivorax sp. TaxID=1872427 RepID=UPI0032D8ED6C